MTDPTPLWPAPVPKRGSRIRHSWRCTRKGTVVETVKRSPTGQARVCEQCQECGHDDLAHRLLDNRGGDDDPAAA